MVIEPAAPKWNLFVDCVIVTFAKTDTWLSLYNANPVPTDPVRLPLLAVENLLPKLPSNMLEFPFPLSVTFSTIRNIPFHRALNIEPTLSLYIRT